MPVISYLLIYNFRRRFIWMNFFDLILVAALKEYKNGNEKQIIKPKDNKIIFVKM